MLKLLSGNTRLLTACLNETHRARPYNYSRVVDKIHTRLPPPHFVTIEHYGEETLIWHWDSTGEPQAHSHADSLEDAVERMNIEFGLSSSDWQKS